MPPGFQFAPFWSTDAQMWMPPDLSNRVKDRAGRSLRVFARLKDGVGLEQARTQMSTIARRLEALYPETNTGIGAEVVPLLEKVTGPVRPTLLVLLATVGFVLFDCVCQRRKPAFDARHRKAPRDSSSSGDWRGALAVDAGDRSGEFAGIVQRRDSGNSVGIRFPEIAGELAAARQSSAPGRSNRRTGSDGIRCRRGVPDRVGNGAASGAAVFKGQSDQGLQQGSRGSAGGSQTRARNVLIACEVSLALVLLVCAGLTIRTLVELSGVDPGFNPRHLLTLYVFAPLGNPTGDSRRAFFDRVNQSLAATPGVRTVSAINHLPIGGDVWTFEYLVAGRPAPAPGHKPSAVYRVIRPGYFQTMQIPLLRGREFSERDNVQSAPVAIISERLAREQWPGGDPVGQSLQINPPSGPKSAATQDRCLFTIVGVVGNARQSDWTGVPDAEFYLPYAQRADAWDANAEAFVMRTGVDPAALITTVENRMREVDPHVVISELRPMEKIIGDKLWRSRLCALLLGGFWSDRAHFGRHRHLRRRFVYGPPEAARDRHSNRAGRGARRCALAELSAKTVCSTPRRDREEALAYARASETPPRCLRICPGLGSWSVAR